jgi:PhnB protein
MQLELFINFDGNCREATEFYAKVFRSKVEHLMTYGEAPDDSNYQLAEADRDRVMYAGVKIGDQLVMFMDMPSESPLVVGNNIQPTLNLDDKYEITRLFNDLKEDGKIHVEPSKTFFSEWYCMVEDKFGVIWQILYYVQE